MNVTICIGIFKLKSYSNVSNRRQFALGFLYEISDIYGKIEISARNMIQYVGLRSSVTLCAEKAMKESVTHLA